MTVRATLIRAALLLCATTTACRPAEEDAPRFTPTEVIAPTYDDIRAERPRVFFDAAHLDSMRSRCGTAHPEFPNHKTSVSEYFELVRKAVSYPPDIRELRDNGQNPLGEYSERSSSSMGRAFAPAGEYWRADQYECAGDPILTLLLAYLVSGDSRLGEKLVGWMRQITDDAVARHERHGTPMLSFGYGLGSPQGNMAEDGRGVWAAIVLDAMADEMLDGEGDRPHIIRRWAEMCLSEFVCAMHTVRDTRGSHSYASSRCRPFAAVFAIALKGFEPVFAEEIQAPMWGGQTYDGAWFRSEIDTALHEIERHLAFYGPVFHGALETGYTRYVQETFYAMLALHFGTDYPTPLVRHPDFPLFAEWWTYATTGALSYVGGLAESAPYLHGKWGGRIYPHIARTYAVLTRTREPLFLYAVWDREDQPEEGSRDQTNYNYLEVAFGDSTVTPVDPAGTWPLVRHFGELNGPGQKFGIPAPGRTTFLRNDWDFGISRQNNVSVTVYTGPEGDGSSGHDRAGGGHVSFHVGRHVMMAPVGYRESDGSSHMRRVVSPTKNLATVVVDVGAGFEDNDGFPRWKRKGPNFLEELAHPTYRHAVVEVATGGVRGGYVRTDLTSAYRPPTLLTPGGRPEFPGGAATCDSVIQEVALYDRWVLRRSIARVLKDDTKTTQLYWHSDRDSLLTILDGTYGRQPVPLNAHGGGIAISTDATRFGAGRLGSLGDPKRIETTVTYPAPGAYRLEFRGGPNSRGEYFHGTTRTGCTSGKEVTDPDPSFEFAWSSSAGRNWCPCEPTRHVAFEDSDRGGTSGRSAMGITIGGEGEATAGQVHEAVGITELNETDARFAAVRAAGSVGDSLIASVVEADTTVVFAMARGFGRVGGMDLTDEIGRAVRLLAWNLSPGRYAVLRNEDDPVAEVTVGADTFLTCVVPRGDVPTRRIRIVPRP